MNDPSNQHDLPGLRGLLHDLADDSRPVDLSQRVHQRARALRRRRAAAGGVAGAAVIGAGGFAWSHAPGTGTATVQPGSTTSAQTTTAPAVESTTAVPVPSEKAYVSDAPLTAGPASPAASSKPVTSGSPTTPAGATARPPAALPPGTVPAGHGCANPWTDEQAGGSPFASSAQREQAATMGAKLCSYVGSAKVTTLTEWISMGGLGHTGEGVTYDLQVTGGSGYTSTPHHGVYLTIFRRGERAAGDQPKVTTESGALRAQWPDGTVVLMTSGEDGPLTSQIIIDPVFDVWR